MFLMFQLENVRVANPDVSGFYGFCYQNGISYDFVFDNIVFDIDVLFDNEFVFGDEVVMEVFGGV